MAAPKTSSILPMIEPAIEALTNVVKYVPQGGEGDHQLCGISESGIKQPADTFARTDRLCFGRSPHPTGQRNDGQRRRSEDQSMRVGYQPVHGRGTGPGSRAIPTLLTSAWYGE